MRVIVFMKKNRQVRKMKITDIQKDIKRRLKNTINEIADEAEMIMDDEMDRFYAGGTPVIYRRTDTLRNAPQVTDKYCTSNSAGVTASLNQDISYSTGTFSGLQVIDAAEHGKYGIVGEGGFWARSELRIEETVDKAILKNF